MVRAALKTDLAVIDATKTVNALHQTGKSGNFEGHGGKNGDYNMHLLGAFDPSLGKLFPIYSLDITLIHPSCSN